MSNEPRPRRAVRAAAKMPTDLAAGASALTSTLTRSKTGRAGSRSGASSERRISGGREKGKGKRVVESEDENGRDEDSDGPLAIVRGDRNGESENAAAAAKAKSKNRPAKPKLKDDKLFDLESILTNPTSALVNLNISDVLNFHTWSALSPESHARLCKLLPPTAFGITPQDVDDFHPSKKFQTQCNQVAVQRNQDKDDPMQLDEEPALQKDAPEHRVLDPSFFTDPHFESAARTFQDHLCSGWLAPAHRELVEKHLEGVRSGALHTPWKDEIWERDHPEEGAENVNGDDEEAAHDPAGMINIGIRGAKRKGKESKVSDFEPLVRKGFLKEGDVISFKKKFISLGAIVEKDALVSAIHPKTSALTLLAVAGPVRDLPPAVLVPFPDSAVNTDALREMYVSTPQQLACALLDLDGRVSRISRPRFDAWKALSVWRWSGDAGGVGMIGMSREEAALLDRGGREVYGTLFYLRGAAFDE